MKWRGQLGLSVPPFCAFDDTYAKPLHSLYLPRFPSSRQRDQFYDRNPPCRAGLVGVVVGVERGCVTPDFPVALRGGVCRFRADTHASIADLYIRDACSVEIKIPVG